MSMQFLYEDGQGHVVDEHGVQPMNLVVDEELFANETISSLSDDRNNDVDMELFNKRCYTVYSDDEKTRFFHLFFSKCSSASAALRQLGIYIRAAQRYVWVQKWQQTDMDVAINCVFLDESAFHINLKRGMVRSKKGTPAIVTVLMTKAKATSILGAISATGLINVSLRVPKRIKKRKLDIYSTGTVTGHYLSFVKATLDEMD
ncbi:hypothetical protein BD408DRAFT_443826 [Parasitella parasitica]|nr:hypothetical protein BD408DRAFT_443826 [Parasitella parasitica]